MERPGLLEARPGPAPRSPGPAPRSPAPWTQWPPALEGMRGRSRWGHARWPEPVRSLLRVLGTRNAPAATGLAQGKGE